MIDYRLIAYDKTTEHVVKTIEVEERLLKNLAEPAALVALETTHCSLPIASTVVIDIFGASGGSAQDFDWFLEPFAAEPVRSDDLAEAFAAPVALCTCKIPAPQACRQAHAPPFGPPDEGVQLGSILRITAAPLSV